MNTGVLHSSAQPAWDEPRLHGIAPAAFVTFEDGRLPERCLSSQVRSSAQASVAPTDLYFADLRLTHETATTHEANYRVQHWA
jgi:hypothetical protein